MPTAAAALLRNQELRGQDPRSPAQTPRGGRAAARAAESLKPKLPQRSSSQRPARPQASREDAGRQEARPQEPRKPRVDTLGGRAPAPKVQEAPLAPRLAAKTRVRPPARVIPSRDSPVARTEPSPEPAPSSAAPSEAPLVQVSRSSSNSQLAPVQFAPVQVSRSSSNTQLAPVQQWEKDVLQWAPAEPREDHTLDNAGAMALTERIDSLCSELNRARGMLHGLDVSPLPATSQSVAIPMIEGLPEAVPLLPSVDPAAKQTQAPPALHSVDSVTKLRAELQQQMQAQTQDLRAGMEEMREQRERMQIELRAMAAQQEDLRTAYEHQLREQRERMERELRALAAAHEEQLTSHRESVECHRQEAALAQQRLAQARADAERRVAAVQREADARAKALELAQAPKSPGSAKALELASGAKPLAPDLRNATPKPLPPAAATKASAPQQCLPLAADATKAARQRSWMGQPEPHTPQVESRPTTPLLRSVSVRLAEMAAQVPGPGEAASRRPLAPTSLPGTGSAPPPAVAVGSPPRSRSQSPLRAPKSQAQTSQGSLTARSASRGPSLLTRACSQPMTPRPLSRSPMPPHQAVFVLTAPRGADPLQHGLHGTRVARTRSHSPTRPAEAVVRQASPQRPLDAALSAILAQVGGRAQPDSSSTVPTPQRLVGGPAPALLPGLPGRASPDRAPTVAASAAVTPLPQNPYRSSRPEVWHAVSAAASQPSYVV